MRHRVRKLSNALFAGCDEPRIDAATASLTSLSSGIEKESAPTIREAQAAMMHMAAAVDEAKHPKRHNVTGASG